MDSIKMSQQEDDDESAIETIDENLEKLVASCKSLSYHENASLKSLLPQIIASLIVSAVMLGAGTSIAHSSVLIAQLSQNNSDIQSSQSENSLIASMALISVPVVSLISGVLMDNFGRLNIIKLGSIPGVIGWITMLFAKSMVAIITARFLVGASMAIMMNPGFVYITEISNPSIRMSLLSISEFYVSLGMILTFTGGWILHWKHIAWMGILFAAVPSLLCFFIPESPAWLILKGRIKEAHKSLKWIHQNQGYINEKKETFAELHFKLLQDEQIRSKLDSELNANKGLIVFKEFFKPTGYKPIIILTLLFISHHFSGLWMTTFYSISFLEETGTNVNPYITSILTGFAKILMTILGIYILKSVKRRTLLIISGLGMAISMFIGGLFTMWIKEGTTTQKWIPTITYLVYHIFSMLGFTTLPLRFLSEFLPLEIRGTGYSFGACIYYLMMFLSMRSYYFLLEVLGGLANLQWFFGLISFMGVVYGYIFIPETRGMKLIEITNYFKEGWIYIGHEKRKNRRMSKKDESIVI